MQFSALFWLLLSTSYVEPYKIDKSCKSSDRDLVQIGLEDAFDMARLSRDALEANPRDPNVNRLIGLLFSREGEAPESTDVKLVLSAFKGIVGIDTENENADNANPDGKENQFEVVLFCGVDRLVRNSRGEWIEPISGQLVKDSEDHSLPACKSALDTTMAFTWKPRVGSEKVQTPTGPDYTSRFWASQISICPWFLRWAQDKRYKTWRDWSARASVAKFVIPIATRWPHTPIDALNLFDKVLLHELTHTRAGGEKEDVPIEGHSAYGWKKAMALARNPVEEGPLGNADSLALFGSGIRLLQEGKFIGDAGNVLDLPSGKRWIVPRMFQYGQTPAAFEGFLTVVRENRASATASPH